jgi:hypothetical protein
LVFRALRRAETLYYPFFFEARDDLRPGVIIIRWMTGN